MLVDAHTHVFPPGFRQRREELLRRDPTFRELYSSPRARMATAGELLEAMDAAGVDAAVACSIGWCDLELAREANDYLVESCLRRPGRLVALCGVNPAWGDGALEELRRCTSPVVRGVGELHPDTQGFDLREAGSMAPLMGLARDMGLPVLLHSSEPVGHPYPGKGTATPDRLLALLASFPENTVIMAHWGGGLAFYAMMPEVSSALANAYFDSAATPLLYDDRVFGAMAGLVGAGRLLFATDFPLVHPASLLAKVRGCGLGQEEERLFLGGNAARLLGLAG